MLNKFQKLLNQLDVSASAPDYQQEGNIAYVNCESKLLRTLSFVGLRSTILGKSIDYLRS